jgi:hypothetical protein
MLSFIYKYSARPLTDMVSRSVFSFHRYYCPAHQRNQTKFISRLCASLATIIRSLVLRKPTSQQYPMEVPLLRRRHPFGYQALETDPSTSALKFGDGGRHLRLILMLLGHP